MRLIDADALMQSLGITNMDCDECSWQDKEWSRCKRGGDFEDACCAIEDAPTIEPGQKKGRWIFYESENDRYDIMKCPFCKKSYTVDAYRIDDIGFTADDFNYCPNCGARMEGER